MGADQVAHVGGGQRQELGVLHRLDAGGAPLAVEHRQLAKDRAGAERRQRDHAAIGVLARDATAPPADDVAGVAGVAFMEDPRLTREAAGDGHLGDLIELLRGELREQRNAPEELDDLLPRSALHTHSDYGRSARLALGAPVRGARRVALRPGADWGAAAGA